jgi:hypothetical protein
MIQTYILRTDKSPCDVLKQGLDGSICGSCPHSSKGNDGHGTCYVRVDTGPENVYKAFKRGKYPKLKTAESQAQVAGCKVRLGTYGDPSAVPFEVWRHFLAKVDGCTGYTHGWKRPDAQSLKGYAMASCDTVADAELARSQGWRVFLVVPKGTASSPIPKAFLCPASEEAGRKVTCAECMACAGLRTSRTASVYIPVHGVAFKQQRFTNNLIQIERGAHVA